MDELPPKRLRKEDEAGESDNSTEGNNDGTTSTSVCEYSTECLRGSKVSTEGVVRKQVTLDRFLTKKLAPKIDTGCRTTRDENAAVTKLPDTLEYELHSTETVEAVSEQVSDGGIASETESETLKCSLPAGSGETIETLRYDSDSNAASENGAADNSSTETRDLSQEHLQLGTSFDEVVAICETRRNLPPLCSSANHTFLLRPNTADEHCTSVPKPDPDKVTIEGAMWDNDHVRLPYSPQNKLLINKVVVGRWEKIASSLSKTEWKSSHDIETAILGYNKHKWDFTELHRYFQTMTEEEHDLFFSQTLPKIAELAVSLPHTCTRPIPLLRKQKAAGITMSQQQAACLLANAFFCTFPSRNTNYGSDDNIPRLPSVNFNSLYRRASVHSYHARHAKLDCLLHYFKRVTTDMPRGTLTFERQVKSPFHDIVFI